MERVARSVRALPAVKWIFDPSFHYTPSYATDVRKTFERIRREMQSGDRGTPPSRKEAGEKVLRPDLHKIGLA
jgi:hypothetical protein